MNRRTGLSSLLLSLLLSVSIAHAKAKGHTGDSASESPSSDTTSDGEGGAPAEPGSSEGESSSSEAKSDEQPVDTHAASEVVDEAQAGDSPVELPGKTYRFVGARYRGVIVPKFMQNLFASGGRTVYVHAFGPEFAIRKDGFEYNLSPWLAFYSMDDTGFKGKNDPAQAWELINSNIKILYLTSDFLWSHEFSPEFALNYGLGAGLGVVFGDLHRNQSTPGTSGQTDPNKFQKCTGPSTIDAYCDSSNKHYGNYTEPSWANGGSKPIVFPWLALQTGLRFKPSKSFAARLDLGFGTSGFFLGLGADYGL